MDQIADVKFKDYLVPGNDCWYTALGTYLTSKDLTKEELDIIFGHNRTFIFEEIGQEGRVINLSYERILNFLDKYYGIKAQKKYIEDPMESWKLIQDQIDQKQPVLVCASIFFLPYNKNYNKEHYPHFLICYGYNIEEQNVIVKDSYYKYDGKISFENFAKGMNVKFIKLSGEKKNCQIEFKYDEAQVRPEYTQEFFEQVIKNTQRVFSGKSYPNGGAGLIGIHKFADWVMSNVFDIEPERVYRLVDSVEIIYQEAARHKAFIETFCQGPELVQIMDSICTEWFKLSKLLVKSTFVKDESMVNALKSALNAIIHNEQLYVQN